MRFSRASGGDGRMSEIGDAAVSYARDYGIAVFPLWPRS